MRTTRATRLSLAALAIASLPIVLAARGVTVRADGAAAEPKPAAATATAPATNPADAVRDALFGDPTKPSVTPMPLPTPAPTDPAGPGTVEPVGPNDPKVKTVLEGTLLNNRVARLTKDEKLGHYLVTFDADGKDMRDPPMIVLPSKTLAAMEELSQKGTRAVRFRVTGEVTEYKGKNYILIHKALALRDLNTGINGG